MSIKKLDDEELLDYLMTSEHDDNINPDDFRYLLLKWRYYYRLLQGRNTMLNSEYLSHKDKYESNINNYEYNIKKIKKELNNYKMLIDSLENRNLSWKERLLGKIKIKK